MTFGDYIAGRTITDDPEGAVNALWRVGIKPDQRRERWVLVLPSDPTGQADPVRHRRLHNLTGRV